MSDDEFDNIPDDFDGVEGIDWNELLSGSQNTHTLPSSSLPPGPTNRSPSAQPSTDYACDDDEIDSAFLAELDILEQNFSQTEEPGPSRIPSGLVPSSFTSPNSHYETAAPSTIPNAHVDRNRSTATSTREHVSPPQSNPGTTIHTTRSLSDSYDSRPPSRRSPKKHPYTSLDEDGHPQSISHKRRRSESETYPLKLHPVDKKGKLKAGKNEGVNEVLSAFEDELTCPICCDIFVAAHLGNPCGHTVCGDCGWLWTTKNSGCSVCRTELSKSMALIPNFAMDSTVAKHIQALGSSGNEEWLPDGAKFKEWNARKEKWKKDAARRDKAAAPSRKAAEVVDFHEYVSILWPLPGDEDEDDEDYEPEPTAPVEPRRRRRRRNTRR